MFNLIKYELKGYYKDFTILLGIVIFLNLLLFTRVNSWSIAALLAISIMISFAAMVAVFIWNINLFSRDLYQDSGYLLYTLPQKGYSILGSKILTALIQNVIVGFVALSFNFVMVMLTVDNWRQKLSEVLSFTTPGFITLFILSTLVGGIYFLATIYFSIALGKVAFKMKKLGKFGSFIIFVVISLITGKVTDSFMNIFPQSFKLDIAPAQMQATMSVIPTIPVNIASLVVSALLFTGLFLGTSYLIENKMDL